MNNNNNQEKDNQELKLLELERLFNQYFHFYCHELITPEEAMPDVYKSLRLYENASKKIKEEIIVFTLFPFVMSIVLFAMTMIEYGYITNRLINYTLVLFIAFCGGYALNAISSKESRKDIKKTIESFKYVKEHKQEYKVAKKKAKQYKEEIMPNKEREFKEINDLLVRQLELIKNTTDIIKPDELCSNNFGEVNITLISKILSKYLPKQPVKPVKTISKVKNLTGTQTNFKVKRLVRTSRED